MLVGNAGVGKTILVADKVTKLKEDFMVSKVPFNYYTTSAMLQRKDRNVDGVHKNTDIRRTTTKKRSDVNYPFKEQLIGFAHIHQLNETNYSE